MSELRFYIDHGVIHDRQTGKHVMTDGEPPFEDSVEQVCDLLNGLVAENHSASRRNVQKGDAERNPAGWMGDISGTPYGPSDH